MITTAFSILFTVAAVAVDGHDFSCGRHEYIRFLRTLQDWTECEETCLGLGAPKFHLAEIENQPEWECVKANLLSYYNADNSNDKPTWYFWLAGEQYLWNTKRQEDDTNNGCLCYRENFYNKKRLI